MIWLASLTILQVVGFFLDAQLLSIILSAASPYIDQPQSLVDALEVYINCSACSILDWSTFI
jgi:hypothetical protein